MQGHPRVSVIVPSYKRVNYLVNCLDALQKQELRDIEVLCVVQHGDTETRHCIAHKAAEDPRFKEVLVSQPGLVAAMSAGLKAAVGEFVTFTDDDTEAPSRWLAVILAHFHRHPECGAVGGQDRLQCDDTRLSSPGTVKRVGSYSLLGRFAATHHCPIEEEFVVADLIKGVNMTYRRELIHGVEIGEGLRGEFGVQICTEQGLAAAVTRAGKQLHFVRDAWLRHYISVRLGEGDRLDMTTRFARDASYNYSYTLWRYQKLRVAACALAYTLVVGSWLIPGVPRLVLSPSKWRVTLMHILPNLNGALAGFRDRQLDPRKV
jgi:GT2 family glycosyltransferase